MERARNGDTEVTWIVMSHQWLVQLGFAAPYMPHACLSFAQGGTVASVSTFQGCVDILEECTPIWALFENVESIDRHEDNMQLGLSPKNVSCRLQGLKFQLSQVTLLSAACVILSTRQSNLEVCLARIREIGYVAKTYLLDSQWYGLPQSRRRVYIVCLSTLTPDVSVSPSDIFPISAGYSTDFAYGPSSRGHFTLNRAV